MRADERYPAQVFWSDEDEGFIAVAPDLPGCNAFGETQAEALSELEDAIAAWKQAALRAGNSIPAPSNLADQSFSGKVALRMPKSLHRDLVNAARAQGVSLNQYIIYLLGKNEQADRAVHAPLKPRQPSPLTV